MRKLRTSFSLDPKAKALLGILSDKLHISQTEIIERCVYKLARQEDIDFDIFFAVDAEKVAEAIFDHFKVDQELFDTAMKAVTETITSISNRLKVLEIETEVKMRELEYDPVLAFLRNAFDEIMKEKEIDSRIRTLDITSKKLKELRESSDYETNTNEL